MLRLSQGAEQLGTAEQLGFIHAGLDERLRFINDANRLRIALLGGIPPCNEAMLLHQDELRPGIGAHALSDHLGQREAGTHIRHPYETSAENLLRQYAAIVRAAEADDGVGMSVVHMLEREKGMQERLDGGARMLGIDHAVAEIGHHLLVRHLVAIHQRQMSSIRRPVKLAAPHRREVRAAALDIQHLRLSSAEVCYRRLRRGIASENVAYGAVRSNQIGAKDEQIKIRLLALRAR